MELSSGRQGAAGPCIEYTSLRPYIGYVLVTSLAPLPLVFLQCALLWGVSQVNVVEIVKKTHLFSLLPQPGAILSLILNVVRARGIQR